MADTKSLDAFEQRAVEAEKQIAFLTKKLEELEVAQRAHRQSHATSTEPAGAAATGDILAITKERDEFKAENKQLKAQVSKLNYRVKHVIRNLEAEEVKSAKP